MTARVDAVATKLARHDDCNLAPFTVRPLLSLTVLALLGCFGCSARTIETGWQPVEAAPIEGRTAHGAVWTGRAMIVFGGEGREGALADGASYAPDDHAWTKLPPSPLGPRRYPIMVWTGREVIVHGGVDHGALSDGASFDPATRTWTPLPPAPLSGLTLPAFAYAPSTHELIVHGGGDGMAFNTDTRTWRLLAKSPIGAREHHRAVWTGGEILFVGGLDDKGAVSSQSATYDPVSDRWTAMTTPARASVTALATERGAVLFGGQTLAREDGCPAALGDGVIFEPRTRALHTIPNATARTEPTAWWGHGQLFLFGGYRCDEILADGEVFDGRAWKALPPAPLSPRFGATAVWTGERAIVWGGAGADGARLSDGAAYAP